MAIFHVFLEITMENSFINVDNSPELKVIEFLMELLLNFCMVILYNLFRIKMYFFIRI